MKVTAGDYKLSVRPKTKRKFERIAKRNRWSLAETADVLADKFIGITDSHPTPATSGDTRSGNSAIAAR